MIDFERFNSSKDATLLYKKFKQDIEESNNKEGTSLFTDLMPPGSADDPVIFQHYFYMGALYAFEGYERQVFRLGSLLSKMFLKTKLPKLSLDDVKLPYPCFYISFPDDLTLRLDIEGSLYQAYGVYVFDSRDPENYMNFTRIDEDGDNLLNEIYFFVSLFNVHDPCKDMDNLRIFSISPGEDDLEKYIKGLGELKHTSLAHLGNHGSLYQQVARLALNLVFYLNSSNREIGVVERPDKKRIRQLEGELKRTRASRKRIIRKLEEKIDREKNKVIVTTLAPSLEENEILQRDFSIPTGRTVREHLVIGHYNYYWCNNKDKEGNKIPGKHVESRWIEPHKRGTAAGKAVRKLYEMKDPNKENDDDNVSRS